MFREALKAYGGSELILGVRPEDLHSADPEQAWMVGEVEMVEDLGSDRFVHLVRDGVELIVRVGNDMSVAPRQTMGLTADPGRLHLFYQGRRISL
jgi:ABC-type sugar transport system ATPase subunit